MDDKLFDFLRRERAKLILRKKFFGYEDLIVGIKPDFVLNLADHNRIVELDFRITAAGIVLLTSVPGMGLGVLIVNEEGNRWDIPSGKVELVDSTPIDTAKRELLEETGIEIDGESLLPLTFALNTKKSKAGMQYLGIMELPEQLALRLESIDEHGRYYFAANPMAQEQNRFVVEPYDIFMSRQSILANSHHIWAYANTRRALLDKLRLMGESGLYEV